MYIYLFIIIFILIYIYIYIYIWNESWNHPCEIPPRSNSICQIRRCCTCRGTVPSNKSATETSARVNTTCATSWWFGERFHHSGIRFYTISISVNRTRVTRRLGQTVRQLAQGGQNMAKPCFREPLGRIETSILRSARAKVMNFTSSATWWSWWIVAVAEPVKINWVHQEHRYIYYTIYPKNIKHHNILQNHIYWCMRLYIYIHPKLPP